MTLACCILNMFALVTEASAHIAHAFLAYQHWCMHQHAPTKLHTCSPKSPAPVADSAIISQLSMSTSRTSAAAAQMASGPMSAAMDTALLHPLHINHQFASSDVFMLIAALSSNPFNDVPTT